MEVKNQPMTMYLCKMCNKLYHTTARHVCEKLPQVEMEDYADTYTPESEVEHGEASSENIGLDIDEVLINEVGKRPALYDYRLPIHLRSRGRIQDLWGEIGATLGEYMPLEDLKKRWRSIRDRYHKSRKIQTTYVASGSGAQTKERPYKYYHLLSFLNDPSEKRKTFCTFTSSSPPSFSSGSESNSEERKENRNMIDEKNSPKRKRNNCDDIETALLKKLNQNMDATNNEDDTEYFCKYLAVNLRKLDQSKRFSLQLHYMKLLQEALQEM